MEPELCGHKTDNGNGIVFTCVNPAGTCPTLGDGRVAHNMVRES